jgi:hypothetical protein
MEALKDLAQGHPLLLGLQSWLGGNSQPATVTLISQWNHDAEALAILLPHLQQRGYRVLDLRGGNGRYPSVGYPLESGKNHG